MYLRVDVCALEHLKGASKLKQVTRFCYVCGALTLLVYLSIRRQPDQRVPDRLEDGPHWRQEPWGGRLRFKGQPGHRSDDYLDVAGSLLHVFRGCPEVIGRKWAGSSGGLPKGPPSSTCGHGLRNPWIFVVLNGRPQGVCRSLLVQIPVTIIGRWALPDTAACKASQHFEIDSYYQ